MASMFSHKAKLDAPPPHLSLNRARWTAWISAGTALATLPVIPAMPYVHLAIVPAMAVIAHRLGKKHAQVLSDFSELKQERGYRFADGQVPWPTEDGLPDGKPLPHAGTWQAEWVPYGMELIEDSYQGRTVKTWRKRLGASPAWRKILDEQRDWIDEYAAPRWQVVSDWWEEWYLHPLLYRRHGGIEVNEQQLVSAAEAMIVDLRIGVAIAGQPQLWTRRLGSGPVEFRLYDELCTKLRALPKQGLTPNDDPAAEPPPPFPRWVHRKASHIYIGKGFMWDQRHSQGYEDLKLRDLSELTTDPKEQGDPRIMGIGAKELRNLFLDEPQFNQMCGVFGSNGVGKTRWAEMVLRQVLQSGYPMLVIDPKSDRDLLACTVEECRRLGRAHQFRYTTLAAPRRRTTWDHICRYNPLDTYNDPAELASRVAACVPKTSDAFWSNVAKAMAEGCLTLCHWSNWYLRLLGRGNENNPMPGKGSQVVPMLLLAMQWARHHREASPADAEQAVLDIQQRMRDPAWKPKAEDEREVVDLMTAKSLAGYRIYSPIEWVPTVRHISEYEIDNTIAFMGWMLRILYPHLYLNSNKTANPIYPRLAPPGEITGKGGSESMWAAYQNGRYHPLELRWEANAAVSPDIERWVGFYDYFVPTSDQDNYDLQRMFKQLKAGFDTHYSDCSKERQKFLEYATTLQSAIKPFLGERARTICAVDSDINWTDVVDQNQVAYFALASMIDRTGATTCAKMILEDIMGYVGQRYQFTGGKPVPLWVVMDEVSAFANDALVDLLNKARGAGLRILILGQTSPDLAKVLGKEGASMVQGNLNTFVQLRTQLSEDAEGFSKRAGEVTIINQSRSMSITPGVGSAGNQLIKGYSANESKSYQQKEVKRVPPAALLNLPRGQAFVHTKGLIYCLAGGLFPDPTNRFQEEIGLHEEVDLLDEEGKVIGKRPGIPADQVVPYSEMTRPTSTRRKLPELVASPSSASAPAPARPSAPATTGSGQPGSSARGTGTFRQQDDLAAMAETPEDPPSGRKPGSSGAKTPSSAIRDAAFDDDAPGGGTDLAGKI